MAATQSVQATRAEYTDFEHVGPGTLAGRYLRTFWLPVYRCEDLTPGRAIPRRIMGEDFTLYRGETGAVHALAFRCAHRGTQLSTGWVEGDDLRCFYHGWKYDGSGQCIEQPAEPEPFCQRIRIHSYPVQEYLGVIFVYLGEGDAPPMPRYPDFENDEEVRDILILTPWPVNYFNRIENGSDHTHLTFVHFHFGFPLPLGEEACETEYGVESTTSYANGKIQKSHFFMPMMNQFTSHAYDPAETRKRDVIVWRVPVDDEHTVDVKIEQIHLTGEDKRRYEERRRQGATTRRGVTTDVLERGDSVLSGKIHARNLPQGDDSMLTVIQDYIASVGQGTIAVRSNDHLGKSDSAIFLIRKIWERELTKLANGKPLKQWTPPASVEVITAGQFARPDRSEVLNDEGRLVVTGT